VNRYEIRWARLDPVQGSEIGKIRPVVIVSLDSLNERLDTVTVCPLTSRLHPHWRCRLAIECEGKATEIAVDHIRGVSKSRIGPLLEKLSEKDAKSLRRLITELYGEPRVRKAES